MIDNTLSWKDHIDKIVLRLSQAWYIIRVVKLFLLQKVLQMIYYAYFNLVMTYVLLFWENSSHSIKIFKLHKKIIRIMMGARIKDSYRAIFKILGILTLTAQHIYSTTMFIVNNRQYFTENSKLYDIKTRKNKNLFQPQSNLSLYQRGPLHTGIKIYNNLPVPINLLSGNINQFKIALKEFLQLHPFYALAEYLNYNRD